MFSKRIFLFVPLLTTGLLLSSPAANACSCGSKPTVLQEYEWATHIVIAQVISVEQSDPAQRHVDDVRSTRMIAESVFKGPLKAGDEIIFAQGGGGDCIWTFSEKDIGERFLFYLSAKGKGEKLWFATYCGRSKNAEYAADDLLYLENMTKVRGKTRLSGTLGFYQTSSIEGQQPIHKLLNGNKVKIIGEKTSYELITNQDGVYELYDLPAGKYVVEPEVPDGMKITSPYGSSGRGDVDGQDVGRPKRPSFQVVVEAGKHAYFDFGYGVNNAIRGKVMDTAGNGMMSVCLSVVPAEGKPAKYFSESDCTDKDGKFEIVGIPPGSYVIAINKVGKISSSEPFPTFYYPNVFEREKAAVIVIGAGHMLEHINIFVPMMEETITVEGVCVFSDGRPVIEGWVQFQPEKTDDRIEGKATAQTDSTGRFAIKILKGLRGELYGEMYAYSGQYENCPELEELIKKSGRIAAMRTNTIAIRSEDSVADVELKYAFRGCKKAK